MAIATGTLIAAGIGAAATLGGAALSSSAQKKAAARASDTAASTAASNNALQKQIYSQNNALLSPYVTRGNAAGNAINSLLGLGGQQPTGQQTMQYGAPVLANDGAMMGDERWANGALQAMGLGSRGNSPDTLRAHLAGEVEGPLNPQMMAAYENYQMSNPMTQPGTVQAAPQNPESAQNAFKSYLDSTGYQFQMDQGNKAINQGYAARGSLQSGAALKALQDRGQETGKSFFKDYLGLLANQQGVGLAGAGAVAGVGTGYANSISANNNMAGGVAAQAALAAGQGQANMYGAAANSIGSMANALGSSYSKPAPPPFVAPTFNGLRTTI